MASMGKLKPLRGTASNLANIVLENGEVAFDYLPENTYGDYGIKMGDGTTVYSELPYLIKRTKESSWTYDEGTDEAALLHNIEHCEEEILGKIYYIQGYFCTGAGYGATYTTINNNVPYKVIGINHEGTTNTVDLMCMVKTYKSQFSGGGYNDWNGGKYTSCNFYSWIANTCPNGYSADIQAKICDMTERWRQATGTNSGTLQTRQTKCKLLNPYELCGSSSSSLHSDFTNYNYGEFYSDIFTNSISTDPNRALYDDMEMTTKLEFWTNSYYQFSGTWPYLFCLTTSGSCGNNHCRQFFGGSAVIRLSNDAS